ncbi:tripartite tricarboxylate transporter substrate binding protein [Lacisediminimonas profundi]|uniref:tripartite tricarboxylate transporter substrate binding protein n=1 Tax=Lacisediminimonas profundi TaxID=2603856 RepID=UPI00124B5E7A|nr:tripartite tricarboxylate transporter substrate binding protein [Lacisediminimonas profundi]
MKVSSILLDYLRMAAAAGLLAGFTGAAIADAAYPSKPIRMVVPFPAGGPSDVLARIVGQGITDALGQQVVVDNRPGAGGTIGSDNVAKSPPDGYSLVLGNVGTHSINASLYKKMPYDTANHFAPVSLVASSTLILVAHPTLSAKTVPELITLAKREKISFGSAGIGSPQHLATELLNTMAGIKMTHVPYKGATPLLNDQLGGHIPLAIVGLPVALPHIRSGKLTPLGVTASSRTPLAPTVPTIAEAGLPGYEVGTWYGVLAPAGTPPEIVQKLNGAITKHMQKPEVRDQLKAQGFEVMSSTPGEFATHIRSEMLKWSKVVKDSGAAAD